VKVPDYYQIMPQVCISNWNKCFVYSSTFKTSLIACRSNPTLVDRGPSQATQGPWLVCQPQEVLRLQCCVCFFFVVETVTTVNCGRRGTQARRGREKVGYFVYVYSWNNKYEYVWSVKCVFVRKKFYFLLAVYLKTSK
jgi:hypothetical protein